MFDILLTYIVLRIPLRVSGLRFPLHTFSEVAPSALWLDFHQNAKKAGVVPVFVIPVSTSLGGHSSNVPLGSSKHPFVSGVCHWCSSCNDTRKSGSEEDVAMENRCMVLPVALQGRTLMRTAGYALRPINLMFLANSRRVSG